MITLPGGIRVHEGNAKPGDAQGLIRFGRKNPTDQIAELVAAADARHQRALKLLTKARAELNHITGSRRRGVEERVRKHEAANDAALAELFSLQSILEAIAKTFEGDKHLRSVEDLRAWLDGFLGVTDSKWWSTKTGGHI